MIQGPCFMYYVQLSSVCMVQMINISSKVVRDHSIVILQREANLLRRVGVLERVG